MRTDYTAYDAKMIHLIRNGCSEYGSLSRKLQAENEAIQPGLDSWRVTDRRLQALRRKGLIVFHNGKWHEETN